MALFKTTAELTGHYPARITLDINDVLPTMVRVEQDYLIAQVLGKAQYDEVHDAYQDDALNSRLTDLLNAARPAVANLTVYHWAAVGAVQLTSTGIAAASAGNGEGIASQVKIDELKRELLGAAYSGLDSLLGFLNARSTDFPLWASSSYGQLSKGLLRTTTQFNQYVDIGNSHWLFWKLRAGINRLQDEDSQVAATLCNVDLYNQLVTQSNAGDSWTGQNAKLIKLIRPAIAHAAIAEAVTELSLGKDEARGIWTFSTLSGGQRGGGPVAATESRLDSWKKYHQGRANEFLQALRKKCIELAAAGSLDLYEDSDCYAEHVAGTAEPTRDPTDKVGNFL